MNENRPPNPVQKFLANYPLTFYFGLLVVGATLLLGWLHFEYSWDINFRQFWTWASGNAEVILLGVSLLLGLTLIASAVAYRQTCKMSQQDYYLWLHQRSTRTFFPFFTPLHDWLRLHFSIYRWWHSQIYSSSFHILFLIIALVIGFSGVRGVLSPFPAGGGCDGDVGDIAINVDTTWSTDQCASSVTVTNNATLTINGGLFVETGTLDVGNGVASGHIVFKGDTLNNLGVLVNATGNVTIHAGSTVTGNGWGYTGGTSGSRGGNGTGGGSFIPASSDGDTDYAGGGGYGGNGGTAGAAAGGSTYGTATSPDHLGSGGAFAGLNGGNGGAAIKIETTANFIINGSIQANGANGSSGLSGSGAGGSGGTIWVKAAAFSGTGSLTANGGNGGGGDVSSSAGGGGGRIVRKYTTAIGSGLTLTALAGTGGSGAQVGSTQNTGPVSTFTVTASAAVVTAGNTFNVTVTAKDSLGATYPTYAGTINFSSTDPLAELPPNYTFIDGDNGVKTFSGVKLKTAGTKTVTVSEVGNTAVAGSGSVNVSPATGSQIVLGNIPSGMTAGTAFSPTVTVKDTYGNVATSFTGTISWTSTDTAATLPALYTFSEKNEGVKTFTGEATLRTATTQQLTALLNGGAAQTASDKIQVSPATAAILELSWSSTNVTAGVKLSPTLRVRDAYGNLVTNFTGKVRFSSTDASATLPTDYTFSGSEGGVKTFTSGVTMKTAGSKTVTLSEVSGANPTLTASSSLNVSAGSFAAFRISTTTPQKVGTGWSETVVYVDAYGNEAKAPISKTGLVATLSLTGLAKFYTDSSYSKELTSLTTSQYLTLFLKAHGPGDVLVTVSMTLDTSTSLSGSSSAKQTSYTGSSAPISVTLTGAGTGSSSGNSTGQTNTGSAEGSDSSTDQSGNIIEQVQQVFARTTEAIAATLEENHSTVNAVSVAAAAIAPVATVAAFGPVSTAIVTGIIDTLVKGASFFGGQVGILPMRLRGRRWGRVRNKRTGLPIGGVFVQLVDEHGQVIDRVMTDSTGHYAFIVDQPGRYWIQIHNPLYERFMSRPLTINNPNDDIVNEDIGLKLIEEQLKSRFALVSLLLGLVQILTFLSWPLLVLGTALALYIYANDPTFGKSLIVSLYVLLWSTKLLEFNYRRPFGVVVDAQSGQPQPMSVVQLVSTSSRGTPTVRSTVTDGKGRFLFVIKPGKYTLTVGKEGFEPFELQVQGQIADLTVKLKKDQA